jgi:hypothetical protein
MKLSPILCPVLLACSWLLAAQNSPQSPPTKTKDDYSGMYSFLREGEFVQLTVEDDGHVTGFVSRYGDSESDRGVFLDQFFKQAKLDGSNLMFTTDTVHGVWYEFSGTVGRGQSKSLSEEGFYILKGTLADYRADADKKVTSKSQQVTFKSFPRETDANPPR